MANEEKRGARKVRKGEVVSKMGAKSVVVAVKYRELHPVYGKVVTRTKKFHAHDESDAVKVGGLLADVCGFRAPTESTLKLGRFDIPPEELDAILDG